jgi:phosphate:Na+ symporter
LNLWLLLAGLAVFIYSMSLLENSLRELAGRPVKKFLQRQTNHPLRAIAGGAIVTAVLQSSSIVLLMVLSFVGAGILSMPNALAVTLGANLGITLDSWIITTLGFRMQLDALAYPLLALALLIRVLFPGNIRLRNVVLFITGFALLFVGLEWMKVSVAGLIDTVDLEKYSSLSPRLFIPVGILVTAVIQSSLATTAITLAALHSGALPLESAVCVIIGSEIGTTFKIVIGAWTGNPDKKRVAIGNVVFNVCLSFLAAVFLYPVVRFIRTLPGTDDPLIALVAFQTVINLAAIILFYPFIGRFGNYLQRLFRGSGGRNAEAKYIRPVSNPMVVQGLGLAEQEMHRLILHVIRFNRSIFGLDGGQPPEESFLKSFRRFAWENPSSDREYGKMKQLHGEILEYLVSIPRSELEPASIERIGELITVSRDAIRTAKRIKDIEHNLIELNNSASDVLYGLWLDLRKREEVFSSAMIGILSEKSPDMVFVHTEALLRGSQSERDAAIERVLGLLNSNEISELDSSSLLNVFREQYSSHKALAYAVNGLKGEGHLS